MVHPFVFLVIYVALIYLRPQEYVAELAEVPIMPVFLVLSLLAWLFQKNKNFEASQHWLLPGLIVAMMVSLVANSWVGGAVNVLNEFYPLVILFYLISTSVDTLDRERRFGALIVALTAVMAWHGIDQSETGTGWTGATVVQGGRITYLGIFSDPNDLAQAFVMSVPMAAYHFQRTRSTLLKGVIASIILAIAFGVYLTNSRGGVLALAGIGGLYVWHRWGFWRAAMLGVVVLPLAMFAPSRMGELDASESSAAGRVDAWYEGISMFLESPIFGVGKGQFVEHHSLTAHNSIVLVLGELGSFGYSFWFAFVGLSVYTLYRLVNMAPPQREPQLWQEQVAVGRMLLFSFTGFLIGAFFLSRSYNILLIVLCALAVAHYQNVRKSWPEVPPILLRDHWKSMGLSALGSIVFMYVMVRVLL
jgi:hypothetical protein